MHASGALCLYSIQSTPSPTGSHEDLGLTGSAIKEEKPPAAKSGVGGRGKGQPIKQVVDVRSMLNGAIGGISSENVCLFFFPSFFSAPSFPPYFPSFPSSPSPLSSPFSSFSLPLLPLPSHSLSSPFSIVLLSNSPILLPRFSSPSLPLLLLLLPYNNDVIAHTLLMF